jgi:hypothetical protein
MTTFFERALLIDVGLGQPFGQGLFGPVPFPITDVPTTLLLDGHQLATVRTLARLGDPAACGIVDAVQEHADLACAVPPPSVVDKRALPPSGDRHDYYSWPKYRRADVDGKHASGVRHDGVVNPDWQSDDYDAVRLVGFCDTVGVLALGEYYLQSGTHGERAVRALRRWFVDPVSRQTPHFEGAQTAAGHGASLVESRHLMYVCDAVRILEHCGKLSQGDAQEIEAWFRALLSWMTTSVEGARAAGAGNNLRLWYDLQVLVYSTFVGDANTRDWVLDRIPAAIASQVTVTGELPAEAERADPSQYMAFGALALLQLTRASREAGVDPWTDKRTAGRTLEATYQWIAQRTLPDRVRADTSSLLRESASSSEAATDGSAAASTSVTLAVALRSLMSPVDRRLDRLRSEFAATTRVLQADVARLRGELDRLEELSAAAQTIAMEHKALLGELHDAEAERERLRAELGGGQGGDDEEQRLGLESEYHLRGVDRVPDRFCLYRIVGNDLVPRHAPGQSLANVRFILEHETELEGCEKHWILNRIVDPREEERLIELGSAARFGDI